MTSAPTQITVGPWGPTVEQVDAVLIGARLPVTDRSRMIFHTEIVRLGYMWSLWDSEVPALNKKLNAWNKKIKLYERRYGHNPKLHFRRRRNECENYICYRLYRLFAAISHAPPRNSSSLYKFTTEAVRLLGFKLSNTKVIGFKAAVGFMTPDAFRMRIKATSEREGKSATPARCGLDDPGVGLPAL